MIHLTTSTYDIEGLVVVFDWLSPRLTQFFSLAEYFFLERTKQAAPPFFLVSHSEPMMKLWCHTCSHWIGISNEALTNHKEMFKRIFSG
jgi:hypothetical protein